MSNKMDDRTIARFIDGELSPTESAAFTQRMAGNEALRIAVDEASEQNRAVRDALPESMRAPHGFSKKVLDQVRCLPSRDELVRLTDNEETEREVARYGGRLVVAAIVIFALGLVFSTNLLHNVDGEKRLQADDQKKLMRELDHKVREMIKAKAEGQTRRNR